METINDYMPLSNDWNNERLQNLKQMFPDWFTSEGSLNIDEVKKVVDPDSVNETERYEFRWFGKSQAKRNAFTPSNATLVFDEERSVNPETSENLIIEGENLEVLKLLSGSYREKIKCIYIDPPYNTGKDFVYSDNFTQDKKAYWEEAEYVENGIKIDTNVETDGRYHSNWLNMMYSRLLLSRQLLREDGVIFISIDDNEVHHLRKLCDEVFGEENFVANIVWKHTQQSKNDEKHFSRQFNYNVVYAKMIDKLENFYFERTEEDNQNYSNPDNDPKGFWRSGDVRSPNYRKTLCFDIIAPNGNVIKAPENGWRWSEDSIRQKIETGEIIFKPDNSGIIRKIHLVNQIGRTPENLWDGQRFGTTRQATASIKELFGDKAIFDTPKPKELIRRILEMSTNQDDLVLDFFAGSGSTGHAVSELNKDGGNRKFILVQMPEATEETSEAYKSGYKKISDITIERNKRVVAKIELEIQENEKKKEGELQLDIVAEPNVVASLRGGITKQSLSWLGFKVFKLQKSNFPRVEFAPNPELSDAENLEALKKYIADKENQLVNAFNRDELVTEILLKNNFTLNYKAVAQPQFKKNEIVLVTDDEKETLICLDVSIDLDTVEYFKTNTDRKFICLERALDTTKKYNLKHYLGDKFNAF